LNNIKCDNDSMAQELERNNLDKFSLTNHFAVINKCFASATSDFAHLKDEALADKDRVITKAEYDTADDKLDNIRSMLNEFRCFALMRIHFLNSKKEQTIVFADWFLKEDGVDAHFAESKKRCQS